MAANTPVGNVTSYQILSQDNLQNDYQTTITNKRIFVNPNANYQQVNSLSRSFMNLSTNTYQDTNLITSVSVNEEIYE